MDDGPWWLWSHVKVSDRYWELDVVDNCRVYSIRGLKSRLAIRNCLYNSTFDKGQLLHHLKRAESGLPSYIYWPHDELKSFVDSRGIQTELSRGQKDCTAEHIKLLEQEDDNPEFEHFLKMAPELRGRIYEYYVAVFGTWRLHAPIQPPLTLTSSLIRA